MISPRQRAFIFAICVAALAMLASCASGPAVIPPGLSAVEIFQRAQDASDRGDYPSGIRYYSLIQTSYPDDLSHLTWASYEIAFLYHKMGRDEQSLSLINDLLATYAKQGDALPPAPRVLASKLKARLEDIQQKAQQKTPPKTP
jgi:outer membrane protein assembly factor BamD (BamD/ComL family)